MARQRMRLGYCDSILITKISSAICLYFCLGAWIQQQNISRSFCQLQEEFRRIRVGSKCSVSAFSSIFFLTHFIFSLLSPSPSLPLFSHYLFIFLISQPPYSANIWIVLQDCGWVSSACSGQPGATILAGRLTFSSSSPGSLYIRSVHPHCFGQKPFQKYLFNYGFLNIPIFILGSRTSLWVRLSVCLLLFH